MSKLSLSQAVVGQTFPPVSYKVNQSVVKDYAKVNEVSLLVSCSHFYVHPGMFAHDIVWIASKYFDNTGVLLTGLDFEFERLASVPVTITVRDIKVDSITFKDTQQHTVVSFIAVDEHSKVICRGRITCVSQASRLAGARGGS